VGIYYSLLLLLIRSFSAIALVLAWALCLRRGREQRARWGGHAYSVLLGVWTAMYLNMLVQEWIGMTLRHRVPFLMAIDGVTSILMAPLVFQVFYHNEWPHLSHRRFWQALLAVNWAVSLVAIALGLFRSIPAAIVLFLPAVGLSLVGGVGVLCSSRAPWTTHRHQRRWMVSLVTAWVAIVFLWRLTDAHGLEALKDACPFCLVFLVTWHTERLTFFDVLLKKAAFGSFSLFLLTLYMAFGTQWIWALHMRGWISTLFWALSVWPLVLLAPWGYRKLSDWLDLKWLGRRFSPAQASRYFLSGLQGATGIDELRSLAAQRLGAVFQAEVEIVLSPDAHAASTLADNHSRPRGHPVGAPIGAASGVPPGGPERSLDSAGSCGHGSRADAAGPGAEVSLSAPIVLHGAPAGEIRIGPRPQSPRFLSEDIALLSSLAEAFSFLLENTQLRERRFLDQQRERELQLNASRSELKALRAQVNPHFLFNALNAIAGLIPRDPDRAERTIEQLAEVFRYALRGSEREWVRLEDELEAVRAYLDVEQARFRDGLRVRMECAGDDLRNARIPAMVVQTLVENATRHGVGAIGTPGVVEVLASASGETLRIEVRDNGPGFRADRLPPSQSRDGGYGLRNVRERLRGHFGDAASLTIGRDASLGMTVVSLEMPRAAVHAS
jgi:anti-sigma regulatory factor (Ser/Thr protein kinase)